MNAHACIFMRMCEAQGKGDGEGENEGEVRERRGKIYTVVNGVNDCHGDVR